jgi:glucose-1-phosphate adenylyltransferase
VINTLVMILAGGKGERLYPLTKERAKPAVPFGARYRIIDFALSNFINSGFTRIKVLTQYLSNSLLIHLARGYNFGSLSDRYVDAIPAQLGVGDTGWYQGTADAVFQNLNIVNDERPSDVAIFGGDHIYKMDVRQMLSFHREHGAACTVAALPFDRAAAANNFGIIEVDANWRIIGFEEKPADPKPIPGMPDLALVSMGNYIFDFLAMREILSRDHAADSSAHDFGKNVIPGMINDYPVYAYNFLNNEVPGELPVQRGYWRDVGTIEAYFEANMDLRRVNPQLNLYNYKWPIHSTMLQYPPVKFVFNDEGWRGMAVDSIIANGSIISGGKVAESVVFSNVFVHSRAEIYESILLQGCNVGRNVRLRRVICDKYVTIEDNTVIGENLQEDAHRFTVTSGGIVVIPKGAVVPRRGELSFSHDLVPPDSIRPREFEPGAVTVSDEATGA